MEDKRQEQEQAFTLEDILKEFGSNSEEQEQIQDDAQTEAAVEEVPQQTDNQTSGVVTDATVRLDKIPEAVVGVVRNAQHIEDEDEPIEPPVLEENTEPYSQEWEPEYEQPISEYIPPRPILFHSRAELQGLKKKLMEGPEKRYYALSEQGLGKLQWAIFLNLLVLILTAGATLLFTLGAIGENRLRFMVFGQFFAMLFSALLGTNLLVEGVANLLHKKFSLKTMLVFTFLICCADGIMGLRELRIPCCAAFSLQMTMALWNEYHTRNAEMGQMDTMRKAIKLDSLGTVEEYYDGVKGILRGKGQVEDFMDTYRQPAKLEKVQSVYALVALCISVATGITAGVLHGLSAGIQVAAVTTLAAVPATMYVSLSRPLAVLQQKLHAVGTVLCGWQGVEGLSGKVMFPIDHQDLFPAGTVKLNGVKFFGERQPDEIIAYATALIETDGGMLAPLFAHLLDSRNGMHYVAENRVSYEGGGIGAEVCGEPVLAGSLHFLRNMGVETPEGIRVNQAVCVAINGELCGLFAISYEKDRDSAAGLVSLCGYRGLQPVLVGGDFMLTEKFIYDRFGVNAKRIRIPDGEACLEIGEKKLEEDAPALALITGTGLAAFAYAATGARALKNAAKTGTAVHMVGGILGMVMMVVLAILGATQLLSPASMFLYELVWLIPGLLITEWTRAI